MLRLVVPLIAILLMTAAPGAGATVIDVPAAADTYSKDTTPSTNYGVCTPTFTGCTRWSVQNKSAEKRNAFLRFEVTTPAGGSVTAAELCARSEAASVAPGVSAYTTSATWTESGLTWANQPAAGTFLSARDGFANGALVCWTVTGGVPPGGGVVAFRLQTTASAWLGFSSRENSDPALRPYLRVTTQGSGDTEPPTAPTNLQDPEADKTQTSFKLTWTASTDNVAVDHYDTYLADASDHWASQGSTTATWWTFSGLTCGTAYNVAVEAVDAAGNRSTLAARSVATLACADTVPPETSITSAPPPTTTSSDASFAFASTEPGSTFACALDAGAPQPCTTPKTYSALAAGAHSFTVQATDAAGNTDPTPATHSWTIEPDGGQTLTFEPVADAAVRVCCATTNYGSTTTLLADASPLEESRIRFVVSGVSGAVTSAKLRLYVTDRSTNGPSVYSAADAWDESTINWDNRPATTGAPSDDKGALPAGAYTEYSVTPLVSGDGTYTFALVGTSRDGTDFSSREAPSNRPQLVVTSGGGGPPPPSGDALVYAVGDFASSSSDLEANAVRSLMTGANAILGLGDFAYQDVGNIGAWDAIYGPKPGGLFPLVFPTAGHVHDATNCADGRYEAYFGRPAFAGYSFDLGGWHIVSLPSAAYVYGCDTASVLSWLQADLAADTHACTLAFWHEPYWTRPTLEHPAGSSAVRSWLDALYADGAELILNSHQHGYQRFAEQRPDGVLDPGRGLREVVAGTGGIGLYAFTGGAANLEASDDTTYGTLRLTLRPSEYMLEFLRAAGGSFTDGPVTTACH